MSHFALSLARMETQADGLERQNSRRRAAPNSRQLFAALDIATGSVIGKCWPRHRAIEFRKFLNQTDRADPADLTVHL